MSSGEGRKRLFRRLAVADDVAREIDSHIEFRAEELVENGWDAATAREEALRLFGDRPRVSAASTTISKRHQRAVGKRALLKIVTFSRVHFPENGAAK